jgi:hypothetical protein
MKKALERPAILLLSARYSSLATVFLVLEEGVEPSRH